MLFTVVLVKSAVIVGIAARIPVRVDRHTDATSLPAAAAGCWGVPREIARAAAEEVGEGRSTA